MTDRENWIKVYGQIPIEVRRAASDTYTPEGVARWWTTPNSLLHASPRVVWSKGTGGHQRVLEQLEDLAGGPLG